MHHSTRYVRLLLSLSFCVVCTNSFAEPYTPAVGSPERVAIANAVRASVAQLGGQFEEDARRGAKFVIAVLKIDGRYAFFEGGGQEVNGEMTYGPVDIVAFLGKGNVGWKVLNLQARGDVPDDAEVAQLRASLPPDFPLNIVNKFWRDLLLVSSLQNRREFVAIEGSNWAPARRSNPRKLVKVSYLIRVLSRWLKTLGARQSAE